MRTYTLLVTFALLTVSVAAPTASAFHHLCPGGGTQDVCEEGHDLSDAVVDLVGEAVGPIVAGVIQACRNSFGGTCPL